MDVSMTNLITRLFEPKTALLILIVLGVFTALYTAAIKSFFDRRLKRFELAMKSLKDKELLQLQNENSIHLKG